MYTNLEKKDIIDQGYKKYHKALNIHAQFRVSNKETSDDLVQETFTKTWKYLLKGGKIDLLKAFLYHILNNLIVDEYRKRKTTSLDILLEKGYEPSIDTSKNLNNILDGKAVLLLIQYLPEKYRVVIHMRYVQHLSLKEISKLTGRSQNTIAVQIHRGLKKLNLLYNHK
jgi:RNA polymerase sigma factor (sigma-70 family)